MYKQILKYTLIHLLLFIPSVFVQGQDTLLVKGMLTGIDSKPVPGVSVSIEGSAEPAITDETGKFMVVSPTRFAWMLISPVDKYKPQRIFIDHQAFISVQLTPLDMVSGHDEVIDLINPGKRKDFIPSFFAPDPGKNFYLPYQSLDQSFQGTIPGMLTIGFSGMPGRGVSSFIRGVKSLNTNSQPLFLIDGIPLEAPGIYTSQLDGYSYNPLSSLNPFDVTNFTVMKDYATISSYGSRASNGIVLIETLKPSEIITRIDFSMRTGFSFAPRKIPQMNSDQYRTFANEILSSSGQPEETFPEKYPALYAAPNSPDYYKYNHNTNWQNEIFRNATMNDVYLRVRGGDEIARYGLSVGYMNQKGIIKETSYDRVTIRFVSTFNIFQWLRMNVSNNLVINNSQLKESARVSQTSPVLTSLFKAPLLLPYSFDEDGNQLSRFAEVESLGVSNPLAVIHNFSAINNNYRFLTSIKIEGDLGKSFKVNSVIGVNFNSVNEKIFMPNYGMETYYDDEAYNAMKSLKDHFFSIYNDNYVCFSHNWGTIHQLSGSAGIRINMNKFEEDWAISKNSHENDEYRSLQDGVAYLREMGGENYRWNRMTNYVNVNYSLKDKYLLTGTISADASSRTGSNAAGILRVSGAPYGFFYSTGFAWRISEERFFKDNNLIEDMKWRVSYGVTGNDDIGIYSSLDYYRLAHYRETSGMVPVPVSNQSLKFETVGQWNTGIDLSFRSNRVNFSLDFFKTKTRDMLVYEKLPFYLGEHYQPVNNGILDNRGIDTYASAYITYKKNFKWNVEINLAKIKNSLTNIASGEVITPFDDGEFISRQGESLLNFYGYVFEGVIAGNEEANRLNLRTEKGLPFGSGDARYADISGPTGTPDGVINEYDKTLLGSPVPDFFGGITNNLTYKRWSLSASIQFVMGNKVFNYLRFQNEKMTGLSNQSANVLNRWHYDGQHTMVPKATWADPVGNSAFSSRWIENGSYVRLKNLTLNYHIPEKMLFFRNAEVFMTATNLLTLSKYLGYDPESNFSYHTTEMGIDYGLAPFAKSIILGVKIGL
ncbi:MAG: SusC/RagA family TonB-linked outer membrane protein [Prolixibacteraceae bacterium]|jgi:TonB-linked SusC/RagA family outer membrane protein|nr:SusC/RagA family TonB-linked outer membrane protein [Prolixibacteraceae bacterium]